MNGGLASARMLARSLAAFPAVLVMIGAVTLGLSLLATTLPRAVDGVVSGIVHYDVADASPLNRDVIAPGAGAYDIGGSTSGVPDGMTAEGAAVWGRLDDQLGEFRESVPEPLRGVLTSADFTAATEPGVSASDGILPASLGLRYDPRYLSRITIIEGREPRDAPTTLPSEQPLEVLASEATALQLEWEVDETRPLVLDNGEGQQVLLVGVFTADAPDAAYWTQATATRRPAVQSKFVPPDVTAQLFVDPAGYPAALRAQLTIRSSVWFSARADEVGAESASVIAAQIRRLATSDHQLGDSEMPRLVFGSRLPELLEDSLARSATTQAVLVTILVSPVWLAVTLELLVARLSAERLRSSLALLAARGASRRQRIALVGVPMLLLGVAAAAVGLVTGLALPGGELGIAGAIAVGVAAVAPAVLIAIFATRGPAGATGAAHGRLARLARVAVETLVLLAAAAAVVAATQRDQITDSGSVDFFSSAVSLLLSLVGCVIALRVHPLIVLRWLAGSERRRGIGAFVGLARAVHGGTAGLVPLLAVLIGVSVAVFSGLLSSTLTTGLDTAARASVGADMTIDAVRFGPDDLEALRSIDGVAGIAGFAVETSQKLHLADGDELTVAVGVVDSADLAEVQAGVPDSVPLDDALDGAAAVMVSTGVADALAGDTSAELGSDAVKVVGPPIAGTRLGLSGNWLLVDRANADSIDAASSDISTRVLVRVSNEAEIGRVADRVQLALPDSAILTTVADRTSLLSTNPAIGDVHTAARLAILGAVLATATALLLTLVLEGPARRRTVAMLSSVGLSRRQGAAVVRSELAPISLSGLLGGAVLGTALSFVVLGIVDLRPFTGGDEQPVIAVDPVIASVVVVLFAAVFLITGALAVRTATRRERRPSPPEKDRHDDTDNHS